MSLATQIERLALNLKVFTTMRWGTKDPVAFKDSQLGLIRLRAFGTFTMKITQPLLFVNSLVGTQGAFATDHVEGPRNGPHVVQAKGATPPSGLPRRRSKAPRRSRGAPRYPVPMLGRIALAA